MTLAKVGNVPAMASQLSDYANTLEHNACLQACIRADLGVMVDVASVVDVVFQLVVAVALSEGNLHQAQEQQMAHFWHDLGLDWWSARSTRGESVAVVFTTGMLFCRAPRRGTHLSTRQAQISHLGDHVRRVRDAEELVLVATLLLVFAVLLDQEVTEVVIANCGASEGVNASHTFQESLCIVVTNIAGQPVGIWRVLVSKSVCEHGSQTSTCTPSQAVSASLGVGRTDVLLWWA